MNEPGAPTAETIESPTCPEPHGHNGLVSIRGVAVVHRPIGAPSSFVWTVAAEGGARVVNTNAVEVLVGSPAEAKKLDALLWRQVVCLTSPTPSDVVPPGVDPMSVAAFCQEIVSATDLVQASILAAIATYKTTHRSKLVSPDFTRIDPTEPPLPDEPALAALHAANHVRACWQGWIDAEGERVRRSRHPNTGAPWIMPEGSGPEWVRVLPDLGSVSRAT